MRIGMDISVLCHQWDGIGVYALDTLKYMMAHPSTDEFYLYADRDLVADLHLDQRFHVCCDHGSNHLLWLLTKLPGYVRRDKIDVFWQPDFLLPFCVKGMRNIVTVHDLSAYRYSEFAPAKSNIAHKLFLRPTCRKADSIIAISHYIEEEIVKCFPETAQKVKMIYNGKKMFENGLDVDPLKCDQYLKEIGVRERQYLLFVGTLSPRKNADIIVRGYFQYREKGGTKKLVLAGNIAKKSAHVRQMVNESKYSGDVVITGYVTEEQKRMLYYHAAMLLYPSRLEGFGVPLLEAMQAEIPVITSNCTSLPEIAEDAAVYLNDIDNVDEMAQRIFDVEEMDPAEKQARIERGRKRVQYFDEMNYPETVYKVLTNRE